MRILFLLFFFCWLQTKVCAQSDKELYPAYYKLFDEGMELFRKGAYLKARGRFNAARVVNEKPPNSKAEIYLDSATVLSFQMLAKARDSIAQNEQLAKQRLIETEANRLGLLSSIAYDEKKFDEALVLAVEALQLMPDSMSSAHIKQAFGEAAKVILSDTIYFYHSINKVVFHPKNDQLGVLHNNSNVSFLTFDGIKRSIPSESPVLSLSLGNSLLLSLLNNVGIIFNLEKDTSVSLIGHRSEIVATSQNQNGTLYLTGARDSMAILWNANGEIIKRLIGHKGPIYGVEFASDDKHLLTRSSDGTVMIWTIGGNLISTIGGESIYLYDAHFSPDCLQIITAAADGTAKLWDLSGKELHTLTGHTASVKEAQFFNDGSRILTRALDNTCQIWTIDGQEVATLQHDQEVNTVFIDSLSQTILTCSDDGKARMWNYDGKEISIYDGHTSSVIGGVGTKGGNLWLTTSEDGTTRLWDKKKNLLMRFELGEKTPLAATFTKEEQSILTFLDKAIVITPIPERAFQELLKTMPFSMERIQEIKKQHKVKPLHMYLE